MTQQKINRVLFLIDRSGSMRPIMKNAIEALNENIRTIREQARESGQDATVSLISFDDEVEMQFFNRPISSVNEIDPNSIPPRNNTALFDAVGEGIEQLEALPVGKDEDVSYLVIALTDGANNVIKKFTPERLISLMRRVQLTDLWTLSFLVPKGESGLLVNRFGIPEGNVMEWDASAAGVKKYAAANQVGIKSYFTARAAGQKAVKSFYTPNVSVKEIRALDDLSGRVTVYDVPNDVVIKPFILSLGLPFKKGVAFYQLVAGKDNADVVQDYKKVLIMEKGKSTVYGGDDARRILNLPNSETKVRPGDHKGFDIFIQSTSTTRKLLSGTRMIYMPSAAV